MTGERTPAPITADLVRLMNAASGLGMMDCKAAAERAVAELDGDYVVALLARHAHGFAVMIRSRDPAVSDAQARTRWDLDHALGEREARVSGGGAWERLDGMSGRFVPKRSRPISNQ